jgi:RNA polymerase sigma-70 factor (ECF subfamily)
MIKKESRTASLDILENEADIAENVENATLDKIQADMLLSVLSQKDRKIVILHAVYGFKHREIAKLLCLPLGSVMRRYKESIAKMKKKSEEDQESGDVFFKVNKQKEVLPNEK